MDEYLATKFRPVGRPARETGHNNHLLVGKHFKLPPPTDVCLCHPSRKVVISSLTSETVANQAITRF